MPLFVLLPGAFVFALVLLLLLALALGILRIAIPPIYALEFELMKTQYIRGRAIIIMNSSERSKSYSKIKNKSLPNSQFLLPFIYFLFSSNSKSMTK